MKLKLFNASTQRALTDREPRITINPKNGVFFINIALAKMLNAEEGDKYSVAQDEERKQDWYLLMDENGMAVHAKTNKRLIFNNRQCAQELASSIGALDAKRIVIKVGDPIQQDGTYLYPLITKGAIIK